MNDVPHLFFSNDIPVVAHLGSTYEYNSMIPHKDLKIDDIKTRSVNLSFCLLKSVSAGKFEHSNILASTSFNLSDIITQSVDKLIENTDSTLLDVLHEMSKLKKIQTLVENQLNKLAALEEKKRSEVK